MVEEVDASASLLGLGDVPNGVVAMVWPLTSICLALLARQLLIIHPVFPCTSLLLILGIGLGLASGFTGLSALGDSTRMWAAIAPELVLYLFLPPLVFSDGLFTNTHYFRRECGLCILLAGPGVVAGCFLVAGFAIAALPDATPDWKLGAALGAIVSATDPAAVLALLKEVGAEPKLSTVVSGESLLNDGSSVVLFKVAVFLAAGGSPTAEDVLAFLALEVLASPLVGLAFALVVVFWLSRTRDPVVVVALTLAASWACYVCADWLCRGSGVLAVVTSSLVLADLGKLSVTGEGSVALRCVWELAEFLANSMVFSLAGTIIGFELATATTGEQVSLADLGLAVALYAYLLASRALVVTLCLGAGRLCGLKQLGWREGVVLWWGGLRGAVGLSLALFLDEYGEQGVLPEGSSKKVLFYVIVTTVFTLTLNGPTTGRLMHAVGLVDRTERLELNRRVMAHIKSVAAARVCAACEEEGADQAVLESRVLGIFPAGGGAEVVAPAAPWLRTWSKWAEWGVEEEGDNCDDGVEEDALRRYYGSVRSEYLRLRDRRELSSQAALILAGSCDRGMDAVGGAEGTQGVHLLDWAWLCRTELVRRRAPNLSLGKISAWLNRASSLTIGFGWESGSLLRLEVAAAYAAAHRTVRGHFTSALLEEGSGSCSPCSDRVLGVLQALRGESEEKEGEARLYLRSAPELSRRTMANRRAILRVITELEEEVETMEAESAISGGDARDLLGRLSGLRLATCKRTQAIVLDTKKAL